MNGPRVGVKKALVALTCMVSMIPYIIPYSLQYTRDSTGSYVPSIAIDFLGPVIWFALLLTTLIVGKWERKLFWLFALFPVACGPLLVTGYIMFHAWLFGFAP